MKKNIASLLLVICAVLYVCAKTEMTVYANEDIIRVPNISAIFPEEDDPQQTSTALQTIFLISIITLVPSILLMMTCFPRIIIVLHFLRSALGTQQMPPNQILIALALFLTLFGLGDEIRIMNETAWQPYTRGEITQREAIDYAMIPMRNFMVNQSKQSDVDLFARISRTSYSLQEPDTIPSSVLIPAFMLGELTKGFQIGVLVFIPFIVIDMVVASTLMAMGMMMLPPAMISLPFKILLFVLVDGWNLTIKGVFDTFRFL